MTAHYFVVKRDGRCSKCRRAVYAGSWGWWAPRTRELWCDPCGNEMFRAADPATNVIDTGTAGISATREHYRRLTPQGQHVAAAVGPWPPPQVGREAHDVAAWRKGAYGERAAAAVFDGIAVDGFVALHDRKAHGTRGNIDHVLVTLSGVWVVDSKHWSGCLQPVGLGGHGGRTPRLFVGRRDCTDILHKMRWQTDQVRAALGEFSDDVPVYPAIAFIGVDWSAYPRSFQMHNVFVAWPEEIVRTVRYYNGPLQPAGLEAIGLLLARRLPASR